MYVFTNPNHALDVQILVQEIIRTSGNPIIIVRITDFLGCDCLDKGVGEWVRLNPNIVWICKIVLIFGQSLISGKILHNLLLDWM